MITINYNWKTYKITRYDWIITQLEEWIMSGGLEEVKENKEMPDIVQREQEAKEWMKQVWDSIRKARDTSILEKLREELERRFREHNWYLCYSTSIYKELLHLLTSLETKKCRHVSDWVVYASFPPKYKCSKCGIYSTEFMPIETKEEPAEFSDAVKFEIERWCMPCTWNLPPEEAKKTVKEWTDRIDGKVLPQFTPWQEIEVSNDGEKWDRWYFVELLDGRYWVKDNGFSWGKFARPIKIEPELSSVPDFVAYPNKNPWEIYLQDRYAEQIEALTTFCQALSRQKPTK